MTDERGVEHHCYTPSAGRLRRRPWTCPFCRRTWHPEGKGAWRTDEPAGQIIGFAMRYPDGSVQTFGAVTTDREPAFADLYANGGRT